MILASAIDFHEVENVPTHNSIVLEQKTSIKIRVVFQQYDMLSCLLSNV